MIQWTCAVLCLLAGAASTEILAQNNWTGAADNDSWFDAGNWSDSVPALGTTIINDTDGNPVIVDALGAVSPGRFVVGNTALADLVISGGGQLQTGTQNRIGGSLFDGGSDAGIGRVLVTGNDSLWATTQGVTAQTYVIGDVGSGVLTIADGGTVRLSATGTGHLNLGLSQNSSGTLNIGAAEQEAAAGAGFLQAATIRFNEGSGRVVFNHTNADYTFGTVFNSVSSGGVIDFLSGTTILTASSTTFSGVAAVRGGAKLVVGNINFGSSGTDFTMAGSARAHLNVADGTFATSNDWTAGRAVTYTTIYADLSFTADSIIEFGLGAPGAAPDALGVGDLIDVKGVLRLDGTLNVFDLGGFSFGRYELFRYGTLDGSSELDIIGNLAGGLTGSLSNDGANNRILLVVAQSLGTDAFWMGGDGNWDTTSSNWTNEAGTLDAPWNDGTAIFRGLGGLLSVTENVNFTEIAFESDTGGPGYVISDGGGDLIAKPAADDEIVVNLSAVSGVTGEIGAAIKGDRDNVRLRKYNGGTVILSSNDNDWKGGTVIEQGILQIGNGGATGHLPGNVQNGGVLAFNRSNEYVYAGVVSGGGALRQIGAGTTILTGAQTYTGQTRIDAGVLQIGNGGTTGSLATNSNVLINANGMLAFNRSGDFTFANNITGTGRISQRSAGLLTLSGNLSGFTGKLLAEAGRVSVGGTFGGAVDVLDGGLLQGIGTVGNTRIFSGGTLAPGNSIGTLTINGNLTVDAGGLFQVEVTPAGEHDRVHVLGNVTLAGGSVLVLEAGEANAGLWNPLNTYDILTFTGTRGGEFEDVQNNFAFLTPTLNYLSGVVRLSLERNDIDFAAVGVTANQSATGGAVQALGFAHPLADAVVVLTAEDARSAFDSLSGEIHASVRGMLLDDSKLVRNTVLSRAYLSAGQGGGDQLWLQALGHQGSTEGSGVAKFERDAVGVLVGADHEMSNSAYSMGWAVGYNQSSAEAEQLSANSDVNSTYVSVYGGGRSGTALALPGMAGDTSLGFRLGASYSWHEVKTDRAVAFPGFTEALTANYDANTTQVFGELDVRGVLAGGLELAPFIGLAWARLETDAIEEANFRTQLGSTASLMSDADSSSVTFSTLGARGALGFGKRSKVQGMVGWRRTLSGDQPDVGFTFLDGDTRFNTVGAPIARNSLVLDGGVELGWGDSVTFGLAYAGQVASDATDHAVQARIQLTLQ